MVEGGLMAEASGKEQGSHASRMRSLGKMLKMKLLLQRVMALQVDKPEGMD